MCFFIQATHSLPQAFRRAREGFALVCEAAHEAATMGLLDTASEYATVAVSHAHLVGDDDLQLAAAGLKDAVDAAIADSAEFRSWQQMRDESDLTRLAGRFRGKELHLVGGKARDWATELREGLGLADLRWHETEKAKSANVDWAGGLQPDRDVVVVITDHVGHDTTVALRQRCVAQDIPYLHGSSRLRDVIAALDTLGDGQRTMAP